MKVLTLYPPYATLCAIDAKHYETRPWITKYRGPLLIHAGKSMDVMRNIGAMSFSVNTMGQDINRFPLFREIVKLVKAGTLSEISFGVILCVVELVDVVRTEAVRDQLSAQELAFGNYADGRWAWKFEKVRRLMTPIPCKGHQKLWDYPLEVTG